MLYYCSVQFAKVKNKNLSKTIVKNQNLSKNKRKKAC